MIVEDVSRVSHEFVNKREITPREERERHWSSRIARNYTTYARTNETLILDPQPGTVHFSHPRSYTISGCCNIVHLEIIIQLDLQIGDKHFEKTGIT